MPSDVVRRPSSGRIPPLSRTRTELRASLRGMRPLSKVKYLPSQEHTYSVLAVTPIAGRQNWYRPHEYRWRGRQVVRPGTGVVSGEVPSGVPLLERAS